MRAALDEEVLVRIAVDDSVLAAKAVRDAVVRAGHALAAPNDADAVVDTSGESQSILTRVVAGEVQDALARGDASVVGAGLSPVLGTCLARVAIGDDTDDVREVHITYALPMSRRDRDDDLAMVTAALLAAEGREWHHGEPRRPLVAEGRRLAWFPAPIGPHHAASLPLSDAVVVRRVMPVQTVTVSVTMRSWMAELVQVAGRDGSFGSVLRRRFSKPATEVTAYRRSAQRWAVVVEVVTPAGVTRAWANGSDLWAAHGDVVVAMAGAASDVGGGLVTAAEVDPVALLDGLSDHGTLRWVVRRHAV